jgi:predicted regulator of Ras-like GTPase activity (Roadblock/LC7/MglB family)
MKQLGELRAYAPDIDGAAVISVEGLIIACSLPDDLEEDCMAAMSAAMLALGERIAAELGRGLLDQVIIKGDSGYALLMSVNETAVLTVLVGEEAKLGLALIDMRHAVADLRGLV